MLTLRYATLLLLYLRMKTTLLIFIVSLTTCKSKSAKDMFESNLKGVNTITFESTHSLRIPHNNVFIEFQKIRDVMSVHIKSDPLDNDPEFLDTKIDTTYEVSQSKFKKLEKAVLGIQINEIEDSFNGFGYDGYTCTISYGGYFNSISYKVWVPHTYAKGFFEVCKLLVHEANLDTTKILRFK